VSVILPVSLNLEKFYNSKRNMLEKAPKDSLSHFPEVCIKEASAGSGKTYALAKRYIQLLINLSLELQEIPLRSILAITFTNKAAIEMKKRTWNSLSTRSKISI